MPTKTVISNHDRARVEKAFDLIRLGSNQSTGTTELTLDEMKSIVLRALAQEFDMDIPAIKGKR